jgi:acetolactate synthase-1/2/3 large subunit
LIDITKDAQQASVVPDWTTTYDLAGYDDHRLREIDADGVDAAVELLMNAERPLILAGNGVIQSGATSELLALAECTGIPVITTLHGLGAFPQDHPLSLGMPGMHGWVHVNRAIQRCDVLLNIGSRFDDRVTGKASTFAPNASVIHVDVDPSEIGKLVAVEVGIVGDAGAAMRALVMNLSSRRSERSERVSGSTFPAPEAGHVEEEGRSRHALRACGMTNLRPWLDEVHQLSRTVRATPGIPPTPRRPPR